MPVSAFALSCCMALALVAPSTGAGSDAEPVAFVAVERGVILPASRAQAEAVIPLLPPVRVESYWTPSREDVAALEAKLTAYVEARIAKAKAAVEKSSGSDSARRELGYQLDGLKAVLKRLPQSRRQYVGYVAGGARRIFVNGLPDEPVLAWRGRFVLVKDGGPAFWQAHYDVTTGQFVELQFNGVA